MSATQPKAETQAYTRNKLISTLLKIGHGDLSLYIPDGLAAARTDADLFGHLIAWGAKNGKVRDAKVALPPLALRGLQKKDADLAENAVAHMLQLSPRDLLRAYDFSRQLTQSEVVTSVGKRNFNDDKTWIDFIEMGAKTYLTAEELAALNPARDKDRQTILRLAGVKVHSYAYGISANWRDLLETGLRRYLEAREDNRKWFDLTALQHRRSMVHLYQLAHKKPSGYARRILMEDVYPKGSVFAKVAALKGMSPEEAAGTILQYEIPFEVAIGAVEKIRNHAIILAILEGMTGNQVITNTKMLERYGVMKDPVLKSAYEKAIERAKTDKKVETFKIGQASSRMKGTSAGAQLTNLQDVKTKQLGGIEGDWVILGDKSSSMQESIELARQISSVIANQVSGSVYLVFFDTTPTFVEVTGLTYDQILEKTRRINASGGTSIGCGMDYIRSKGLIVNGIAIASDGGENTNPVFATVYAQYCKQFEIEPPVYLFHVPGDPDTLSRSCEDSGVQLEKFDLGRQVDYYALPNIVATLKANRYALFDAIMETPLLTIDDVFSSRKERSTGIR